MSLSIYRKVGIASVIMMGSVFLSRVIGFVREMVIAYAAGAGGSVDAYQVAFVLPEILNHVVASGFLSVTFIPIFSHYLAENDESQGWRVFSIVLNVFGAALVVLIAAAWLLAPQLVTLLAPGITDPAVRGSAVRMTRIILPAQFFFFSGGLFMAVQFSKEKFFLPALAPLIYNLGIIAGGVTLGPRLGMEGFAWGVLGGAFAGNFAVQFMGARRLGMSIKLSADVRHPDFKKYIFLTLPLMIGLTMTFSTEIFLKFFGSFLPPGSIAGLNYGLRIMLMMVGFFGQAVGVAAFPFMARLAAENNIEEMNRLLNKTLRYLALIIPISIVIMVLRHEVVLLLFQRGRFDAEATQLTSVALCYLMIGAVAFAAQTVVVRGYYAIQNTLYPAVFGTIAVALSIPLYILGMWKLGVPGVAMAISISAIFQVTLLFVLWNRRSGNREGVQVYGFYLKVVLLSLPLGVLLERLKIVLYRVVDTTAFNGSLVLVGVVGTVFVIVFITLGYLFKVDEISGLTRRVKRIFGL